VERVTLVYEGGTRNVKKKQWLEETRVPVTRERNPKWGGSSDAFSPERAPLRVVEIVVSRRITPSAEAGLFVALPAVRSENSPDPRHSERNPQSPRPVTGRAYGDKHTPTRHRRSSSIRWREKRSKSKRVREQPASRKPEHSIVCAFVHSPGKTVLKSYVHQGCCSLCGKTGASFSPR
jgi:hypothetical protein